ncbi:MAG: polysaccharide biosynthesis/export family protein [Bdellovibrionales bacterium]
MNWQWQENPAGGGKIGKGRQWVLCTVLLFLLFNGCALNRGDVEKSLMAGRLSATHQLAVADAYRVGCPDILRIDLRGAGGSIVQTAIDVEGRVDLPGLGRLRVEGRTPTEIAAILAQITGVAVNAISVQVAEYNSQQIYLFGQIRGSHHSIPYTGPETVLDVLQRVGGITPGAEPNDVFVIRSNIMDGKRPEVFHVDLRAIVMKKDQSTNISLQPFDQVHVGETRQACVERCIPPWLRPLYQALWATHPTNQPHKRILQYWKFLIREKRTERQEDTRKRRAVGES